MNELPGTLELSLKASRFAHGLLLTICIAAIVFSFSPFEESVYKKAVTELNALVHLSPYKLQVDMAKNHSDILKFYDQINSILGDYGFTYISDGTEKSMLEILPEPPYDINNLTLDEIYYYLNFAHKLEQKVETIREPLL